jgi:hypothetical protein
MADSVKQVLIQGAGFIDYQKSKGLIKQNARKPRLTRKRKDEDEGGIVLQGGYDAPPPPPQLNVKTVNVARMGANANPMPLQATKVGGNGTTPVTTPVKEPTFPKTPITNVATPFKPNFPPTTKPNFPPTTPTSGGNSVVVNTNGHMPNPQPSTTPLPAVQAAQIAGTQDVKEGGSKGKIELAPSKKNKTRHGIVLAPPRESKKRHVRGHTRKIRVQLSNMKRRMHTAKQIHKQSSEKSITEVRKLLEDAKLIRPPKDGKSSVPEKLLRNMYSDYLVLRSKAL